MLSLKAWRFEQHIGAALNNFLDGFSSVPGTAWPSLSGTPV